MGKRMCLVCRMGADKQKVEPIEVLGIEAIPRGSIRVRVFLCEEHKEVPCVLFRVPTGEKKP